MSMRQVSQLMVASVVLVFFAVPAFSQLVDRTNRAHPGASKIANEVIDLLDSQVELDTDTSNTVWESEPFRTTQANRIGLRVNLEMEIGSIRCSTGWQFVADDEFQAGLPIAGSPAFIGDDIGTIGDDPGISGERPDSQPRLFLGGPSHFSDVYGLRAKIVCEAVPGPDFGGGAAPTRGRITDVKVLLRRE